MPATTRPLQRHEGQLFMGQVPANSTQDTPCFASREGATQVRFYTNSDQNITVQVGRVDSNGTDRYQDAATNIVAGAQDQQTINAPGPFLWYLRFVNAGGTTANVVVDVANAGVS